METILFLTVNIAYYLVLGLQIAMIARMIISWVPGVEDSKITDFINAVTEPMIIPVRRLFEKRGWFRRSPIDIPFMVTYFILTIILLMLEFI